MSSVERTGLMGFWDTHKWEIAKSAAVPGTICVTMCIEYFRDNKWIQDPFSNRWGIGFATVLNTVSFIVSHYAIREFWRWRLESNEEKVLKKCNADYEQAAQALEEAHHKYKDKNIDLQGVKKDIEVRVKKLEAKTKDLDDARSAAKAKRDSAAKTSVLAHLESIDHKIDQMEGWLTHTTTHLKLAKTALEGALEIFKAEAAAAKLAKETEIADKGTQEQLKIDKEEALRNLKKAEDENIASDKAEDAKLDLLRTNQDTLRQQILENEATIGRIRTEITTSDLEAKWLQQSAQYYANEQLATQGAYKHSIDEKDRIIPPEQINLNTVEASMRSLGSLSLIQLQDLKITINLLKSNETTNKNNAGKELVKIVLEIKPLLLAELNSIKQQINYLKKDFSNKLNIINAHKTTVLEKLEADKTISLRERGRLVEKIAKKRSKYPLGNAKIPPWELSRDAETKKITAYEEETIKAGLFYSKIAETILSAVQEIDKQKIVEESATANNLPIPALPIWTNANAQGDFNFVERTILYNYKLQVQVLLNNIINDYKNIDRLYTFFETRFKLSATDLDKTINDFSDYEITLTDIKFLKRIEVTLPKTNIDLQKKYQNDHKEKNEKVTSFDLLKKYLKEYNEISRKETYFTQLLEKILALYNPALIKNNEYKTTEKDLKGDLEISKKNLEEKQNRLAKEIGLRDARKNQEIENEQKKNKAIQEKENIRAKSAANLKSKKELEDAKAKIGNLITEISKRAQIEEQKEKTAQNKSRILQLTIDSLIPLKELDDAYQTTRDNYDKAQEELRAESAKLAGRTGKLEKELPLIIQARDEKRKGLEVAKKNRFEAVDSLSKVHLTIAYSHVLARIVARSAAAYDLYHWKWRNPTKTTSERLHVHTATSQVIEAKITLANLKRSFALKNAILNKENPNIVKSIELKYELAVYQQKKHELDQQWRAANVEDKPAMRKALLAHMKKEEELFYDFFVSKVVRGPIIKDQTPQTLREKCCIKVVIGTVDLILDKMLTERIRSKHEKPKYPYHTVNTLKKHLTEHMHLIKQKDDSNTISLKEMTLLCTDLKSIQTNEDLIPQELPKLLESLKSLGDIKEDIAASNHENAIAKLKNLKNIRGEELAEKYSDLWSKTKSNEVRALDEFPKFLDSLTKMADVKNDIIEKKDIAAIEKLRTLKDIKGDDLASQYLYFLDLIKSRQQKACYQRLVNEKSKLVNILNKELMFDDIAENRYLKLINDLIEENSLTLPLVLIRIDKLKEQLEMIRSFHEEILSVKYVSIIRALDAGLSFKTFGDMLTPMAEHKHYVDVKRIDPIKAKISLIQQYDDKPYIEDYEKQLDKYEDKKISYRLDKYNLKKNIETAEQTYFNKIKDDKKMKWDSYNAGVEIWTGLAEKISYYIVPAIFFFIYVGESLKQVPKGKGQLSFKAGLIIWGLMTGVHLSLQSVFPRARTAFRKAITQ